MSDKKKSRRGRPSVDESKRVRKVPNKVNVTLTREQVERFNELPDWVNRAAVIRNAVDLALDDIEAKL